MRFVGFIGPSYKLNSVNVDCQRCINLYAELDEIGTGKDKEVASLVATPGLITLASFPQGPCRALWTASDGTLFAVYGPQVFSVSSLWIPTLIGTLSTFTGPVSMTDNGYDLAIVDGTTLGYAWTFETIDEPASWNQISFPGDIDGQTLTGVDQVTFQDQYFIFNASGTEQFFISGLDSTVIDPLDYKSADGSPDTIMALLSDHRDLWLFGQRSCEVWFNSGATTTVNGNLQPLFPFDRISGAYVESGCAARFSVAKMDNTVFWLGQDDKGQGIVYQARGYIPTRISTHAVEEAIQGYAVISDAVSYCYQENGHSFYVLNFTSAQTTWVFDTTTKLWHERVFTNQGLFERHRAQCHAFAYGLHVVGDYANANLYQLTAGAFSDFGQAITRQRVAPHISQDMKRVFYNQLQLDIETGTGIDGLGQGVDPQAMMQFSDDGGHSWSNEKWTSFGKIGNRKARAMWRRLGYSRDRVFRMTITDPVKVTVIGCEFDVTGGAN